MQIPYEIFEKVDLRSGTVTRVEPFQRAQKPAYKVWVDFGEQFGIKKTSAQITAHYTPENLIGRQVVGCLNLLPKNIAGFVSEFLLMGVADEKDYICLLSFDRAVPNGKRVI